MMKKIFPYLFAIVLLLILIFLFTAKISNNRTHAIELKKQLTDPGFGSWRSETGDWKIFAAVSPDPENEKKLITEPGTGVFFNGNEGRTVPLISKDAFGDIRAHIEFMLPKDSNSGIYFMGRYEVQIYDSWNKPSEYPGIECGGIYQRWDENRTPKGYEGHSPRINAARPPGAWQWFDVVFRAPRFDKAGNKISDAEFDKVYFNGYLIQKNIKLSGPTRGSLYKDEKPTGPLLIQGDHGPVAFRNIWVSSADINPFFAMDTGTRDEKHRSAREQVTMLGELGYDGIDHTGCEGLPELLEELDNNGKRLFAVYLDVWIDDISNKYNAGLPEAIQLLKNQDVILWVPLRSKKLRPSSRAGDSLAVKTIREIADMAAVSGLKVALYPHNNFWMERVEDAVRVAEKTDRDNVGVTFNLCHWLKSGDEPNLISRIRTAMPYLYIVTINGADHRGGWKELIRPLDSGTYDVYNFLRTLKTGGYDGPVGLQGYGIGGDVYDNLKRSMAAWQKMNLQYMTKKQNEH